MALVVTGGTIGSVSHGGLAVVDPDIERATQRLVDEALQGLDVELVLRYPFIRHSEELGPTHWMAVARVIRSLSDEVTAAVVLHGTDTAAYTSAALTYLLCDVDMPVVVTGAGAPAAVPGSDAAANLRGAVVAAAAGLPSAAYLAFSSGAAGEVVVHLGTRVRKSTAEPCAFTGVARRPVAVVRDDRITLVEPPEAAAPPGVRGALDDRVQVVGCHPGQRIVGLFEWAIANGMRGVLVRLYPSRTAPTGLGAYSAEAAVRSATDAGVVVGATVREPTPGATGRYPSTDALEQAGAVLLDPLPTEAALPKLMWALAQSDAPAVVRRRLRCPVRGDTSTAMTDTVPTRTVG